MSTNLLAGAVALAAMLFSPGQLGVPPSAGTAGAGAESAKHLPHPIPVSGKPLTASHCQSKFGATGDGFAAHRHWRACAGAGREDHPYVNEFVHGEPRLYLDVSPDDEGPHDDF